MSLERRLGIKEGEHFAAVAHAAAVTVLPILIVEAAIFAAPFFFLQPLLDWQTLGHVILGALLLIGALLFLRTLVKWRGTLLAITEKRLILVRRDGLFAHEVTELPYDKIHEVSYRVRGFAPTLFGYGSLLIESAGSDETIEMKRVHHPQDFHRVIVDLQSEAAGGPGDFGAMLQAISRFDDRKLQRLREEIERTIKGRV